MWTQVGHALGSVVLLSLLAVACSGERIDATPSAETGGGGGTGGIGGKSAKQGSTIVTSKPMPPRTGDATDEPPPAMGGVGGDTSPEGQAGVAGPGVEGGAGGTGGASSSCEPGTNLLRNSSFEVEGDNLAPAFWKQYGTPATAVTIDDELALAGEHSLRLIMPTSYEYWARQSVDIGNCFSQQGELSISGSYRVNRLTTMEIAVIVNDEAIDGQQLWLPLDLPTAVDTWVPFEVELVAPSAKLNVNLWAVGPYNNEPATTLWFDDVRLARAP